MERAFCDARVRERWFEIQNAMMMMPRARVIARWCSRRSRTRRTERSRRRLRCELSFGARRTILTKISAQTYNLSIERARRDEREHVKRIALMREHVKDVMREMSELRERARSAREALAREKHLAALDAMNRERSVNEKKLCEKDIETQNERLEEYSRRASAYEAALERLRVRAESAGAVCDIVRERIGDDERDLETLKMYEIEDERLLQALDFELGKVSNEAHKSQSELEDVTSHRVAVQSELHRVEKTLKEAHARRVELQEDYSSACTTLSERQGLIRKTMRARDDSARVVEEKRSSVSELAETAKRTELENKSLQSKLTVKEQLLVRKTEKCQELKGDLTSATQTLETATHMRVSAARSADAARNRRREAEEALKAHENARDEKSRHVERAKRALEDTRSALLTSEQCLKELHAVHDVEAANLEHAQKLLAEEKAILFQTSKYLHDQKDSERRLGAELHGAMTQSKNLRETEASLQAKIVKQRELMYTTSLQLQQLDRKTARLEGVRSNEEKEVLEALIESLKFELKEQELEFAMLAVEAKANDHKVERSRMEMVTWCDKATHTTRIRDSIEVEAEGSERHEKSTQDGYEIAQVQLDELRLQLSRRRRVLFLCTGQVQELEKRKTCVIDELATKHTNLSEEKVALLAQINALQQEAHAAIMNARHGEQHLANLRSRYDVVRAKSPYGENVNIDEQNDYLRIVSKQREELEAERADLCERIRIAEQSVDAVRQILEDTERSNSELRCSLMRANDNKGIGREEWSKTTELLENLQIENDGVARLREREVDLTRQLDELKARLAASVVQHNERSIEVDAAQRAHDAMRRKYRSQKQKLKRAKSASAAAVAAYRLSIGVDDHDGPTCEEKRIRIHQIDESIRKASDAIGSAASASVIKLDARLAAEHSALSPTSSLVSFFTFASSATQSVASSVSSLVST